MYESVQMLTFIIGSMQIRELRLPQTVRQKQMGSLVHSDQPSGKRSRLDWVSNS